jgi:hypothetical protein
MSERLSEATLLRVMAQPDLVSGDPTQAPKPSMPIRLPSRLPSRARLAGAGILTVALVLTTVLFSFWFADTQAADALPWGQILTGLTVCVLALLGAQLADRTRGDAHG